MGLTSTPMTIEAQIGTKPAPGVIATRPITAPVEAPASVGLLLLVFSISIQESIAAAQAVLVVIGIDQSDGQERNMAGPALPAFETNHPNHSSRTKEYKLDVVRPTGFFCLILALSKPHAPLPAARDTELICTTPASREIGAAPSFARKPPPHRPSCAMRIINDDDIFAIKNEQQTKNAFFSQVPRDAAPG